MTDEQSSRNNLAYNTDNIGTMTLIFFQVTTLIEKLKNVAGGHIPVNMMPNLGDEDLNDESESREAEENLVQRLCHKMQRDFRFAKKLNGFKLLLSSALGVVKTALQSVRNVCGSVFKPVKSNIVLPSLLRFFLVRSCDALEMDFGNL